MPLNRQAKFESHGIWVDCGDVTLIGAAEELMEKHNPHGIASATVLVRDEDSPEVLHKMKMRTVTTYECTNPRGDTDKLEKLSTLAGKDKWHHSSQHQA